MMSLYVRVCVRVCAFYGILADTVLLRCSNILSYIDFSCCARSGNSAATQSPAATSLLGYHATQKNKHAKAEVKLAEEMSTSKYCCHHLLVFLFVQLLHFA